MDTSNQRNETAILSPECIEANNALKVGLGGTPDQFLMKREGREYKGEDGCWYVCHTAGHARMRGAPPDALVGDYVRVCGRDGGAMEPPLLVRKRGSVVVF